MSKKKDSPKAKTNQERVVKSSRQLPYVFSDIEQLAAGKKLGEVGQAIRRLEEEKKQAVSGYKFKLDEQEAIKGKLENQLLSGFDTRIVPVTITLNKPKSGKKTVVRMDTNEVVGVEDMDYEERQEQLRLDAPAPVAKPKEEAKEFKGAPVLTDEKAEAIETILETEAK